MADADAALAEQRPELQRDRGREGSVPSDPTSRCDRLMSSRPAHRDCSHRRDAAPAETAARPRARCAGREPADRWPIGPDARRPGEVTRSRRTRPKCAECPSGSTASMASTLSRIVPVAQRAPAAGVVAGHAADGGARGGRRHRPGTTGRCGFNWRFSSSSTMPGSTRTVRAPASRSSTRVSCFEPSMTKAGIDRLPALRGAATAWRDRQPGLAGKPKRPARIRPCCAVPRRQRASSGRPRHRWRSARAPPGRGSASSQARTAGARRRGIEFNAHPVPPSLQLRASDRALHQNSLDRNCIQNYLCNRQLHPGVQVERLPERESPPWPQRTACRRAAFLQIPGPSPVPDRILRAMSGRSSIIAGPSSASSAARC